MRPLAKSLFFLALSAILVIGYLFLLTVFRGKLGAFGSVVPAILIALAALILNWRFFRSDGQSLAEIGFDVPPLRVKQAAIGFIAGCLLVSAWALTLVLLTHVSWVPTPAFAPILALGSVIFAIFNNAGEELVYRGYLFLLLARSYGVGTAVICTCGLFAVLHIQGGVPWPNALAGVFTSALIFAALFVRWQRLPLVLAFHFGTNFMQELIGLRISGLTLIAPTTEGLTATQGNTVLVATAAINTIVASGIFISVWRMKRIQAT